MSSTQRRLPPPWLFGITALPYGVYGGYQHGHALRFAERRSARPVSAVSSRCGSHSALNPSAASGSLTVTVTPLRTSICRLFPNRHPSPSENASTTPRRKHAYTSSARVVAGKRRNICARQMLGNEIVKRFARRRIENAAAIKRSHRAAEPEEPRVHARVLASHAGNHEPGIEERLAPLAHYRIGTPWLGCTFSTKKRRAPGGSR